MLRSEAEYLLKNWPVNGLKIFKFVRWLVPNEFITFRKEVAFGLDESVTFVIDKEKSTLVSADFNGPIEYDIFLKMLTNSVFIYEKDYSYIEDVKRMKTGGCDCGGWAIQGGTMHDKRCPLFRIWRE